MLWLTRTSPSRFTTSGHGRCRLLQKILLVLWVCAEQETIAWVGPLNGPKVQQRWCRQIRKSNEQKHLFLRTGGASTSSSCTNSSLKDVGSGDSYQKNIDDPVLQLPILEAKLASRTEDSDVDVDDLQTAILDVKTAAEFGVRKSQSEFYEAFSNGDMDAMSDVWSESSPIRCVHPGMASVKGRKAVMESWKRYFSVSVPPSSSSSFFTIEPERVQIEIYGLIAICSCIERNEGGGQLEALNVYRRENGSWKMTLHQAGPIMMFK